MNNYRGNRWYKCDFHIHTPASKCFADQNITPEIFIARVVEQNLKCIAVTDHNTGAWIDKIKVAAEPKGIIVFPGVELTCSDAKVHLLVLFDPTGNAKTVEDFIIRTEIERDNFGKKDAHSDKGIKQIIDLAGELDGIVIPAHVDDYNGWGNVGPRTQEEILANIPVVQMVNEELIKSDPDNINIDELLATMKAKNPDIDETKLRTYVKMAKLFKKDKIGIVTFSDNPNKKGDSSHGLWGIGEQYTWIKMDEKPTLESLRQAFLFPELRIKNCYEISSDIHKLPQLWIKKISISNIELLDEKPLIVDFNPHLTSIIGGRGSGKSSIVRFLTGVFIQTELGDLANIKNEFDDFFRVKDTNRMGILKESTLIDVEIIKNDISYKITLYDFKKNSYDKKIEKYNAEIQEYQEVCDIDIIDLFEVDIYNQKQIYELAQTPSILRNKIDTSIEKVAGLKQNIESLKREFNSINNDIESLKLELRQKTKIELELTDIDDKIKSYKNTGIDEVLNIYQKFVFEMNAIKKKINIVDNKVTFVKELRAKISNEVSEIPALEQKYEKEIITILNAQDTAVRIIEQDIFSSIEKLQSKKNETEENLKRTQWHKDFEEIKKAYKDKLDILNKQGIDTETIKDLIEKKKGKELQIEEGKEKNIILQKKIEAAKKLKNSYIKERESIFNLRTQYVATLLAGASIRVKIEKFRDRNDFINQFRSILQKNTNFDDDIKKSTEFCFNGDVKAQIEKMVNIFFQIRSNKKIDTEIEYSGRFINVIKGLNEQQINELNLLLPEDNIEIQYKTNNDASYITLNRASPGQKTSSILTFILSDGVSPLVLDQPEDDLDNHLISDLIVERVKTCKEKRQIIIVTHNANIPVNGDAEWIVAMDSTKKEIGIGIEGTIENGTLKKEICNVMEGGDSAFKMRSKRYGFRF